MKNILKTTIFAFLLISLGSCTNDKEPVAVLNGFELSDVSESAPPSVLLATNASQPFIDLEWEVDYGVPTGNTGTTGLTYKFIVTDKDNPTAFVKSEVPFTRRDSTLTVNQINVFLNGLSTFKCSPMNVEIRVESTLGNVPGNQQIQISTPISLTVTGYTTTPKELAFVKDLESPANAPKLKSSSYDRLDDFQGYMYLEAGNYKFYQPDDCGSFVGAKVYGTSSGDAIEEGSESNSINIPTSGHYFVTANLNTEGTGARTFKLSYYKAFGIFGTAIRTVGSINMVPMNDDNNSNVWKITIELFKGRLFKFKSSDWTVALSGTPPSVPSASSTIITTLGGSGFPINSGEESSLFDFGTGLPGKDIKVPGDNDGTKQKYDVVIDVSKPRNYTCKLTIAN
jgi:hypothetical protein